MTRRSPFLGLLALVACSHSAENSGIVLDVDADGSVSKAAISQLVVTVNGKKQTWTLARPLPGSLGITTSPGIKAVEVDGLSDSALLGHWSGQIEAIKGTVVTRDVVLTCFGCGEVDGGMGGFDSGASDVPTGTAGRSGTGGAGGGGGTKGTGDALSTGGAIGTGGGAGGAQTDVGGTGGGNAPIDASRPTADGNVICLNMVPCNGVCIDPSTSCCVATDCNTSCVTCDSNHTCTPVKNQSDPSLHCTGICDTNGACKATQGHTCSAATDCANGTCADGYCCDSACTGSCQACSVSGHQGTCTTLGNGASPHLNHPACTGSDVCAGYCNGTSPSCTYPSATTSCGTAYCSSSFEYQATGNCNSGKCIMPAPVSCPNGGCSMGEGGCLP